MAEFERHFRAAKEAGLGVTLHIAEVRSTFSLSQQKITFGHTQVTSCPAPETLQLLSYKPDRLGHATFLDDDAKKIVHTEEMCIEICLSSNLLCKTVPSLDAHHLRYYLGHDHPVAICVSALVVIAQCQFSSRFYSDRRHSSVPQLLARGIRPPDGTAAVRSRTDRGRDREAGKNEHGLPFSLT